MGAGRIWVEEHGRGSRTTVHHGSGGTAVSSGAQGAHSSACLISLRLQAPALEGVIHMIPVHPGRILKRELAARSLSANRLALALRVPSGRITSILHGKRAITPETALRLARYFGNSPQFWMNLQMSYDLALAEQVVGERIKAEVESAA